MEFQFNSLLSVHILVFKMKRNANDDWLSGSNNGRYSSKETSNRTNPASSEIPTSQKVDKMLQIARNKLKTSVNSMVPSKKNKSVQHTSDSKKKTTNMVKSTFKNNTTHTITKPIHSVSISSPAVLTTTIDNSTKTSNTSTSSISTTTNMVKGILKHNTTHTVTKPMNSVSVFTATSRAAIVDNSTRTTNSFTSAISTTTIVNTTNSTMNTRTVFMSNSNVFSAQNSNAIANDAMYSNMNSDVNSNVSSATNTDGNSNINFTVNSNVNSNVNSTVNSAVNSTVNSVVSSATNLPENTNIKSAAPMRNIVSYTQTPMNSTVIDNTYTKKENPSDSMKSQIDFPTSQQQPTTPRHQQHIDLKNQGRIRITLHGTEVYTNPQIRRILNRLHTISASRAGPNLITALASTGIYAPTCYEDEPEVEDMDLGPLIEQGTQVNANNIDDEMFARNIQDWEPLVVETPLNENNELITSNNIPAIVKFNKKAFINYTLHAIPEDVGIILSLGPKFAVPVYYNTKDFDLLKETAIMLNDAYGNPMMDLQVRSDIINHIEKHKDKDHTVLRSDVRDFFHKALANTKKFINDHPDIIVTQADKARAAILMNKKTYIDKGENLLKDETTYKLLVNSSTPAYMKMNERLLNKMVDMKLMSETAKIEALRTENKPANVYFLVKNHKPNAPVRPIVNTQGSMFYKASKIVAKILVRARDDGSKYNVINSRQACERLKHLRICPDEKLYSLDIVSMFTNIPVDRAIVAVMKRQKTIGVNDDTMQLIIEIITHVCKTSTEMAFNNKIYKQIRGLRMGSSLSPILADFVVEDMLDTAFLKIQRPVLLIKYVDDILTILQTNQAETFLHELNSIDTHIKFEMEMEKDGFINYLDFTVYNDGWYIRTKWFQKHVSSGQFLNYNSHHSSSNRWNTALQYVITMLSNSHHSFWNEIEETALDRLTRNSYPMEYAKEVIKTAKDKIKLNSNQTPVNSNSTQNNDPTYTYSLPYIPGLTEKVQKIVKNSASSLDDTTNIQIPAKPIYKMSQLIYNKQKNSNSQQFMDDLNANATVDLTQQEQTFNDSTQ